MTVLVLIAAILYGKVRTSIHGCCNKSCYGYCRGHSAMMVRTGREQATCSALIVEGKLLL